MKQKGICMKRIIYITIACLLISLSLQRHKFSLSRSVWKKDCKNNYSLRIIHNEEQISKTTQRWEMPPGLPAYTGLLCRIYRKPRQY